jgi:hypothetical protein
MLKSNQLKMRAQLSVSLSQPLIPRGLDNREMELAIQFHLPRVEIILCQSRHFFLQSPEFSDLSSFDPFKSQIECSPLKHQAIIHEGRNFIVGNLGHKGSPLRENLQESFTI